MHERVPVVERSQVVAARLVARHLAEKTGMSADDTYRVGIVATELATNLVKHATGGEILLRPLYSETEPAVELVAIDRGPGIANLTQALTDGHSSAGSAGTGLGAIRRLSSMFDVYSLTGAGTVVLAHVTTGRPSPRTASVLPLEIGTISVPKAGEQVSGDGWAVQSHSDAAMIAVADGLGHGPGAREAAEAALTIFDAQVTTECASTLERMHAAIRHTRGAAGAVIYVRRRADTFTFAGVGNVAAVVLQGEQQRQAVSSNGTLGHQASSFRDYQYPWSAEALLVVHTDGLSSHWALNRYPGLSRRHPVVIAAVLYRDFSRERDDVTVLVAREAAA